MTETADRAGLREALLQRRLQGRARPQRATGIRSVDRGAALPLSFAQRRLWILDQLQPHSTEYLMTTALRLRGRLDPEALRTALDGLVSRHEVLRTRYPVVAGEPVQVIDEPHPVRVSELDLRHLDAAAREHRIAQLATSQRQPVDLAGGPVLRTTLVQLDAQEHVLLLTVHHIACDGWSEEVVLRELDIRYAAALAGRTPSLAPLPVQYADFAVWQRESLSGKVQDTQLAYWRDRLAGLTPLELPGDRPRPAVRDASGDLVSFVIDAPTAQRIVRLAREHGATSFMALLAAFKILLSRYSGQSDVAVGTPVAGRDRAEVQDLIGLFLNTLVLRTDLAGAPSFVEVLTRVRDTALDAYSHQDLPFERLVDEFAADRDPSRNPLFSAMFLYENATTGAAHLEGLGVERIDVGESTAKLDLTMGVTEEPDGSLAVGINYASALFDRATIERMAGHFGQLVAGVAAAPHAALSRLDLLSAAERHQVLQQWNDTAVAYPPGTLPGLIEAQVRRSPDAVALRFDDDTVTYRELNVRANRLAHHLLGLGVGADSTVGVCLERGTELVVTLLAILKAGAAYLPLDPQYPPQRLAYLLEDSAARVVVTDRPLTGDVRVVSVDTGDLDARVDNPVAGAAPDTAAYVIYTSGSTGRPKGVLVEHRAIVNRLLWMQQTYRLDATDRVLQKTPYSFDVSVWEFFWPLTTGASLVLARPDGHRDPRYLAEVIAGQQVTTLHFVPSMLRAFLTEPFDGLPSVRRMICSGEALTADLVTDVRERIGCELHNLYGPTEAAVDVTAARCVPGAAVTIGRPIANTQTYVLDGDLNPTPVGVPGELLLGGVQLARGYLGRAALTARQFIPDPFGATPGARLYRTGDLVRYLPDGSIEYLGRLDHQVKIRGHRVELGEIETVLHEHPDIKAAVVTVHEGQLVAYLVGSDVEATRVRGFLRERLPETMVPAQWVLLDALPMTVSGKVDRNALPAPDGRRSGPAHEHTAPRTVVEQSIADAMAEAIGVDQVGVHDRFFDLGGDSIRAIRAIGALRAKGLDLSVQQIFTHQSVAELAALAGEAATDQLVEAFTLLSPDDRGKLPAGLVDAYPTGQIQAGMVYEMLADPTRNTYQNVTSFQIIDDGPFSLAAVQQAAQALIERHEILRTSFELSGYSEPLQLVHADTRIEVGFDDLRALPPQQQRTVVDEFVASSRRTPLDIGRAPLLRWHVHRTGEREWLLTHTECHAILDGWSHHSLIGELRACYRSIRDGLGTGLGSPPPARYADFIALEKQSLLSGADRDFWHDRLDRFDRLELPADTALSDPGHFEVRVSWRELDPALRRLAAETRTSMKTVLYAAHLTVLGLITGQRRFFAGAVCNGRPELLDGDLVRGMYLNTVPFAVDLRVPSWRELLRQVFAEELALWPHRRYPLPAMQQQRGDGRPLIDTVFGYLDFHVLDEQSTGFGAITDDSPNEFTLDVWTFPGELRMACRPGWVSRERLEAMAATFLDVLAVMVEDPDADPRVFGSHILAQPTVRRAAEPPLPQQSVPEMFAAQVRARPESVALQCDEQTMTYRELDIRSNQVAQLLCGHGVGPEVPVAICMQRGVELVVALLGTLKAGGYYVPLDPEHPDDRVDFVLHDTGTRILVTQPQLADRFARHEQLHTVALDATWSQIAGQPTTSPPVDLAPDNLAYVMYTSGSTGRPKGVQIPHRGIVRLVHAATYADVNAEQVFLLHAPLAFDASTFELWAPLCNGARLAVFPPGIPTANTFAPVLRRHAVSVLWQTTILFQHMAEVQPSPLAGVRHLVVGGDVLSTAHVRRALELGVEVSNVYGPTECTTFSTVRRGVSMHDTQRDIPIGLPIQHTHVYVVDEELNPVPFGVPGELLVGGPGLARGYLSRAGLTAERFVPDPGATRAGARVYRTGDIVRQDPDGTLHFLGRRDHQVKIRGHRVELGEVEAALATLTSVRATAAGTHVGADGQKQLVGYVVAQPGESVQSDRLGDLLRQRVPDFLVPTAWVTLDELPLNANGKLDRAALPAPSTAASTRAYAAARTPVERAMVDGWAEMLGVDRVGVHDDFYALGGHSLIILRIIALLRQRHGIELTVRSFMENRTIEQLAASIETASSSSALIWLNRNGSRAPLFCVHPGGGSAHWYLSFVEHFAADQPIAAFEWPGLQAQNGVVPSTEQMAQRYLEELRAATPHGPYRLFGWCGGSGIATEMANRLVAEGEQVTFILLDPGIDSHDREGLWNELALIERCVASLEALAAAGPDLDTTDLRRETLELLEHLVDDVDEETGISLPEHGAGDMWLPAARIWREVMQMCLTYRQRHFPGTLHLIVSDELAEGEHEVASGQTFAQFLQRWREVTSLVHVHRMSGDHFSVVKPPHVARLVELIEKVITAEEDPGPAA